MGKMRFKLSHVMPHAWFYKLREVGKPDTSPFKTSDATRKSVFTSPINHKAIDIPFPAETPKRSPHIEPPFEDFTPLDQLHLLELSDECRPSIVLPYAPDPENIMSLSLEEDNPHRISSAPDVNACPPPCALNFDVRELERRLKALDLEDRRKYHSSPMLLSVSVPSPMINSAQHTSIKSSHTYKGLDGYSLDACGARECTSNVCIADELSVDIRGANGRTRKFPLLNVSYADAHRPSEGCVSNGEGLCGSIDESNRHSTSSSDTGLERGSSSMWERDVFSITSDGSEAFMATCPDEVEPAHKSRQRFWKLRERMSPSLYGNAHMDSGMSRFYEDDQEVGLGESDMISGFFKSRHVAGDVQDARRRVSYAGNKDSHMREGSHQKGGGPASYVRNGAKRIGDVGKRGSLYRVERSSPRDSHQREDGKSFSIRKHEAAMYRSIQSLPDYNEQVDSLSLPGDRNDLLSMQDDSGDEQLSVRSRISAGRFSYARCKERLLSSRTLAEQSRVDAGTSMQEEETLSNYAKFKLTQRGLLPSKVSASNVGMYLDPGLFNSVSTRGKHRRAHDNVNTGGIDLSTDASRSDQGSEHMLSCRQSTSSYHSKSPQVKVGEGMSGKSNMQEQVPSWFKGTLRAVREKTKDRSFKQFSPSTSAGGTPSTTSRSGVFDSFAMVKCSYDARHDFKESMVEMIMEKGLHSSHDMVELLQCYLTLNADVYHDTIVKVFTEVWSEMFEHI